jgi:hypothetical protein
MFNFPAGAAIGDVYPETPTGSEPQYMWDGEKWVGLKEAAAPGGGGASVSTEDSPPLGPADGDLWWKSDTGTMYVAYDDGTSIQWVSTATAGGGFVSKSGDEMAGPLKIAADGTEVAQLTLSGGGTARWIQGNNNNDLPRWAISMPGENGDFILDLADDNGVWAWSPLRINHTTQAVTLQGSLDSQGSIYANGSVVGSRATANSNAHFALLNSAGAVKSYLYWEHTQNLIIWSHQDYNINLSIGSDGVHLNASDFWAGAGIKCKQGMNGGYGANRFDAWYNPADGNTQWWIDATYMGVLAYGSDYRIKKDVQPLGSTWDQVKALRPISYSHKDYFSPIPVVEQGEVEPHPLVVNDDKTRWGFLAHELQETLIEDAASGVKDQADCLQSPNPWTIIAALTKTVQEMQTRIEALEAR